MVLWCIESLQEHVFFSFFDIAGFQVLRAYLLIQFDIFCNCCCAHIVGTTIINAGASKKCNQFLSAVQHWKVALLLRSFPSTVTFHFTSVLQLLYVWVFKLIKKITIPGNTKSTPSISLDLPGLWNKPQRFLRHTLLWSLSKKGSIMPKLTSWNRNSNFKSCILVFLAYS